MDLQNQISEERKEKLLGYTRGKKKTASDLMSNLKSPLTGQRGQDREEKGRRGAGGMITERKNRQSEERSEGQLRG